MANILIYNKQARAVRIPNAAAVILPIFSLPPEKSAPAIAPVYDAIPVIIAVKVIPGNSTPAVAPIAPPLVDFPPLTAPIKAPITPPSRPALIRFPRFLSGESFFDINLNPEIAPLFCSALFFSS